MRGAAAEQAIATVFVIPELLWPTLSRFFRCRRKGESNRSAISLRFRLFRTERDVLEDWQCME